jgi:two-component sensor histidine kinase
VSQQRLLLDEINHRVKNTMASIQSIAWLTRSGSTSVNQYVNAFQGRLIALSAAYDLLTENNWRGADIQKIVQMTTAAYNNMGQIEIQGVDVQLSSRQALSLAAALQELCTNAAKYGSLSVTQGRLRVEWRRIEQRIQLDWMESNGPVVKPPTRRGFGSKLIRDMLAQDPEWYAELTFEPSGLRAQIILHIEGSTVSLDS